MDHLDDLPKRPENHATEDKAEAAFHNLILTSNDFVLQASDRKDYGTDCQIEVIDHESATNVRIHVQLKGTEKTANSDESISVEIQRSNLNYLLIQPHSFFACYHVPSNTLRFCFADAVIRRYEHKGQNWSRQQTLTVTFSEILTHARLKSLATLAKAGAASSRNARVVQTTAHPKDLPAIVKSAIPDLHVPGDEERAVAMLSSLYHSGADQVIDAAFEKFASVLGRDHDAMNLCYMAVINLGMAGPIDNAGRITDAVSHLTSKLNTDRHDSAGLHYSIGNGLSALRQDAEAVKAYETALEHLSGEDSAQLLAWCYSNLGSSYKRLGDTEKAVEFFRKALCHNDQLPQPHHALGIHCLRNGEFGAALEHFDQIVVSERTLGQRSSVSGWRINALFNVGDGKAAFREISKLLSDTEEEVWIWPWCIRQVASFGRDSTENAKLSIPFWKRYLKEHPNCPDGVRELLLNKLYLRQEDQNSDLTYPAFKLEFETSIQYVESEEAAYLWDRLGHWAEKDENWEEAARCFRIAYDLAGGIYGYCLGTTLSILERYDESLPILLAQAEAIQPDDKSWYQVAVVYEKLGRVRESIDAYKKSIELNPDYALAWFNMGGVHWNAGERQEASRVWKSAVEKFPDHQLTALLRREIPSALR